MSSFDSIMLLSSTTIHNLWYIRIRALEQLIKEKMELIYGELIKQRFIKKIVTKSLDGIAIIEGLNEVEPKFTKPQNRDIFYIKYNQTNTHTHKG